MRLGCRLCAVRMSCVQAVPRPRPVRRSVSLTLTHTHAGQSARRPSLGAGRLIAKGWLTARTGRHRTATSTTAVRMREGEPPHTPVKSTERSPSAHDHHLHNLDSDLAGLDHKRKNGPHIRGELSVAFRMVSLVSRSYDLIFVIRGPAFTAAGRRSRGAPGVERDRGSRDALGMRRGEPDGLVISVAQLSEGVKEPARSETRRVLSMGSGGKRQDGNSRCVQEAHLFKRRPLEFRREARALDRPPGAESRLPRGQ